MPIMSPMRKLKNHIRRTATQEIGTSNKSPLLVLARSPAIRPCLRRHRTASLASGCLVWLHHGFRRPFCTASHALWSTTVASLHPQIQRPTPSHGCFAPSRCGPLRNCLLKLLRFIFTCDIGRFRSRLCSSYRGCCGSWRRLRYLNSPAGTLCTQIAVKHDSQAPKNE